MRSWVIGSGGLLGQALVRQFRKKGVLLFTGRSVPWEDSREATQSLRSDVERFFDWVGNDSWSICWTAGQAVVSTADNETLLELKTFQGLVDAVAEGASLQAPGVFFLTSSAGGIYAGASTPPFGISSPPKPISAYGRLKLAQEEYAREMLHERTTLVIGRIANLYGGEQDPRKAQGLVYQMCRSTMQRKAINVYVPMETARDYIYVDDAAQAIWALIESALAHPGEDQQLALIGSGQSTTIAELVSLVQKVTRRRVPIALGTHASARNQPVDLRLHTTNGAVSTPLISGIRRITDQLVSKPWIPAP
jgi:UDP-glucose 4-epimerase